MSLNPGIGAGFMPEVASVLLTHNIEATHSDVNTSLRNGPVVRPLGRYLTRTLRAQIGMPMNAPQATLDKMAEKMQPLREAAKAMAPKGLYSETLKSVIISAGDQKVLNMETRQKIFKKRGSI